MRFVVQFIRSRRGVPEAIRTRQVHPYASEVALAQVRSGVPSFCVLAGSLIGQELASPIDVPVGPARG
jgi:hypothetical protein